MYVAALIYHKRWHATALQQNLFLFLHVALAKCKSWPISHVHRQPDALLRMVIFLPVCRVEMVKLRFVFFFRTLIALDCWVSNYLIFHHTVDIMKLFTLSVQFPTDSNGQCKRIWPLFKTVCIIRSSSCLPIWICSLQTKWHRLSNYCSIWSVLRNFHRCGFVRATSAHWIVRYEYMRFQKWEEKGVKRGEMRWVCVCVGLYIWLMALRKSAPKQPLNGGEDDARLSLS